DGFTAKTPRDWIRQGRGCVPHALGIESEASPPSTSRANRRGGRWLLRPTRWTGRAAPWATPLPPRPAGRGPPPCRSDALVEARFTPERDDRPPNAWSRSLRGGAGDRPPRTRGAEHPAPERSRCALLRLLEHHFHAAVLGPAGGRLVVGDRPLLAHAHRADLRIGDAVRHQVLPHRVRAGLAEGEVLLRCAGAVGVALDQDGALGALQRLGDDLQPVDRHRLEIGLAGGKGNAAGEGDDRAALVLLYFSELGQAGTGLVGLTLGLLPRSTQSVLVDRTLLGVVFLLQGGQLPLLGLHVGSGLGGRPRLVGDLRPVEGLLGGVAGNGGILSALE